jgi:hypothetical protein
MLATLKTSHYAAADSRVIIATFQLHCRHYYISDTMMLHAVTLHAIRRYATRRHMPHCHTLHRYAIIAVICYCC